MVYTLSNRESFFRLNRILRRLIRRVGRAGLVTFVMINRVIRLMDVAEVKREGENWTDSIYLPATAKHVFPRYHVYPVFVFCKSYR